MKERARKEILGKEKCGGKEKRGSMVKFDSTSFGEVWINGQKHGDVLIVEGEIIPRDIGNLKKIFGTSHRISEDEANKLLEGKPEYIVIGKGQDGVLQIDDSIMKKFESAGVQLIDLETPEAIEKFNELHSKRKKVNALIHTTC
ncbi:hypothetical protein HY991_03270 [Candidatus Micrarchaeota archaeon]|nr:hypothetical protein [Candidatus Micrarchaeota archaeon]